MIDSIKLQLQSYVCGLRVGVGVLELPDHHDDSAHEGIPRIVEELGRGKDQSEAQGESDDKEDEGAHDLQRTVIN